MTNVLIVDDDRFARLGLISMIPWEQYGMKVIGEAANGRRAMEFIRQNKVNLMFVDITMPIMDGMELIRQAKAEFKDIHFVVLSFHEEFEYVQEALRLGALDYISKDKMEVEDYNGILNRIRKKLEENMEQPEDDSECVKQLESLLKGVLWLYDNYQMDLVLEALDTHNIQIRSLEKLIAVAMAKISAETQIQFKNTFHFESMETVKQYLKDFREYYRQQIKQLNDSIYARLMLAAEYIWQNSAVQIQSTEVANAACYSRSYFSVTFKKVLGITFNAFIRRERVHNARALLTDTKLPQSEIARCCGYGDVSNFKNAFKEVTGELPGTFRAKRSEKENHMATGGASVRQLQ